MLYVQFEAREAVRRPDVITRNPDVKLDSGQSGHVAPLTLEALRVRQSVSCRIDLLGLLLDVVKKAD
jgi:hypothetical protein